MDGKGLEKRGGNGAQRFGRFEAWKPREQADRFATRCDQLPFGSHGKECHEEGPPR
jgi:hypothetical protein